MNSVILIGRLTRDPELYNQGDVAKMTLAVDRGNEETDFIPVTVFGKQAELVGKFVKKGHLVAIQGRLNVSTFVRKDETKGTSTVVIADNITFCEKKPAEEPKLEDKPKKKAKAKTAKN